MKPSPFGYAAVSELGEAIELLSHYGEDAKILAGGQSLVPLMNFRLARPECVVDVNDIAELDYLRDDAERGWLSIGALAREETIGASELVERSCRLLTEATRWIGHPAIRHRGTIGGSLAHSDPAGEYPLVAALLGAEVVIRQPADRTRRARWEAFSVDYLTTSLQPDEMVVEVRVPKLGPGTGWGFQEVARRHGDFAMVAAAATVDLDDDVVRDVRIALGGAGPTAFRARDAEELLRGERWCDEAVAAAANQAAVSADPVSDIHGSSSFRRHLCRVLTERSLREGFQRAKR